MNDLEEARRPSGTISVAMVTCNGSPFVSEQLDSVAAQSRLPDELVISDDGSDDTTVGLCRAFGERARFAVHILVNDAALGPVQNRSIAMAACMGETIASADQDDVWHPDKLRRMEQSLADAAGPALVLCDGTVVDEHGRALGIGLWEAVDFDEQRRARVDQGQRSRSYSFGTSSRRLRPSSGRPWLGSPSRSHPASSPMPGWRWWRRRPRTSWPCPSGCSTTARAPASRSASDPGPRRRTVASSTTSRASFVLAHNSWPGWTRCWAGSNCFAPAFSIWSAPNILRTGAASGRWTTGSHTGDCEPPSRRRAAGGQE